MKKLFLGLALLLTAACTNPSMERGFASLNQSLTELAASTEAMFIEIDTKIVELDVQLKDLGVKIEEYKEVLEAIRLEDEANIAKLQLMLDAANAEAILMLARFNAEWASLLPQVEEYVASINEYANSTVEHSEDMTKQLARAAEMLEEINNMANDMSTIASGLATSEQMQVLLEQMNQLKEGTSMLVASSDSDADGVMNALDKCPDTELGVAVDADGCSADQL